MIPKVKFYIRRPEEDAESIIYFLDLEKKQKWKWSNQIFEVYPELKIELEKEKTIKKKEEIVRKFLEIYFKKNRSKIGKNGDEYEKVWNGINDEYMKTLEKVLEIKWPKKDKEFYAILSLNPICPRWIKERTFDVYFRFLDDRMKATLMHEILHFLWFEKWKEIFPKTKEKEFDSPHLVWKLSEMVPRVILSDKRIQKIFKHEPLVYNEWKFAKIKEKPLLNYFDGFYKNKKDFADFVKKSWAFVKENEKEINKI